MAFTIKFTGIKIQQGQYETIFVPGEVPGLLCNLDESRFTEIKLSLTYSDSFIILTPAEALKLYLRYYRVIESLSEEEDMDDSDSIVGRIEKALSQADFVIAHRYEWESGMS